MRALVAYFLLLGATKFGGPIALAGAMQRDLVDDRKWITPEEYLRGLALAQLAPGPLAAQLAIYIGWVRGGLAGATLVGVAFVLPSFVMVLALSWLYVHFHGLSWMQAVFYGVGAAVIGIVARSVVKLARLTLARDALLWVLFAVSAVVTAVTEREIIWLFLGCGIVAVAVRMLPRAATAASLALLPLYAPLARGIRGVAPVDTLLRIGIYFAEAGAFVFGSGLAVVPFLYGGVVERYRWLTEREFLDAVAIAMITPGPVVITVGFIGYLTAGPLGATIAAAAVFLPCYLFVVVLAPHYERWAE
ncbi:MAG TPA: chromate efflux transporter, partial [Thermoanaerobaculia bacterium]|nr:chromate efflux transporter [Thermoanaerobaculia bacterium]